MSDCRCFSDVACYLFSFLRVCHVLKSHVRQWQLSPSALFHQQIYSFLPKQRHALLQMIASQHCFFQVSFHTFPVRSQFFCFLLKLVSVKILSLFPISVSVFQFQLRSLSVSFHLLPLTSGPYRLHLPQSFCTYQVITASQSWLAFSRKPLLLQTFLEGKNEHLRLFFFISASYFLELCPAFLSICCLSTCVSIHYQFSRLHGSSVWQ